MRIRRFIPGLILVALAVAACGGSAVAPPPEGSITSVAGDGQSATVGSMLQAYQVKVTGPGSAPAPGATVRWSVISGGGSVSAPLTLTDAAGQSSVTATLGTTAGPQLVRANASGISDSLVTFVSTGTADAPTQMTKYAGDGQSGPRSLTLPVAPGVRIRDQYNNGVAGVTVTWLVTQGGGRVASPTTITGGTGQASIAWTMGDSSGTNTITATAAGLPPVSFSATAVSSFTVLGGGRNVPERYGSDLWVADGYAYSGTWYGPRVTGGPVGNALKIWRLSGTGAPILSDSIIVSGVADISDVEVSADGQWLVFTTEGGSQSGLYVYRLPFPGTPVFEARALVPEGLHTGTLAVIGGTLYAFTAKDPSNCALRIFNLSQALSGTITVASSTPIPDNYCIHDTFVRDGYAFVFAWNSGLYIFDVGNGTAGGTPAAPTLISHATGFGGETHNGWWFHNPTTGEKKYLFIGQEGPGGVGTSSSGDIHVVDVSSLRAPVEVATFHLPGAGVHNFWMNESAQRLYAAYYNGGVVALDVSGTLSGDLSSRLISQIQPGGAGQTYVWGVMLYNGSLYVNDMLSGFWQLSAP